jgi:hypothetical protein
MLVALFVTTTVAPGITPPAGSTAVPDSEDEAVPCANEGSADKDASMMPKDNRGTRLLTGFLRCGVI